jgi:hypothetical protein
MTSHRDRLKSIHTPPKRSQVSPSKREPLNEGPTDFQLQRKAEAIGQGTVCDVESRRVAITGGKLALGKAEFASSSALALLYSREKIIHPQYRAGCEYQRLHRLLFGSTVPRESGLTKVMATSLDDRLKQEAAASREERDDEEQAEWMAEQRVLYERGENRLRHIRVPVPRGRSHEARVNAYRMAVRAVLRATCIDDRYPANDEWLYRLKIGLGELAETWDFTKGARA